MKRVRVEEIRTACFQEYEHVSPSFYIDITYKVSVYDGVTSRPMVKIFDREEDVELYINFIKERENDYKKVIKEIEI